MAVVVVDEQLLRERAVRVKASMIAASSAALQDERHVGEWG